MAAFPLPQSINPASALSEISGFGAFQICPPQGLVAYQATQKTHALLQANFLIAATSGVVVAVVSIPSLAWIAPAALMGIAVCSVRTYLSYRASLNYFPPDLTNGLNPQDFRLKSVGENIIENNGSALAIANGVESKKYKHDLIRNAQESIFLTSYMGEEALDETLDLIRERMDQKRNLKVFILGSDIFLTSQNKQRLCGLQNDYHDRFFYVQNPEIYYSEHPSASGFALSTNHLKLMAIDQGIYMIVGGCALRPFWTDVTGEVNLPTLQKAGFFNFNDPLEAKGFRDMDFAFKTQASGAGATAFLEGAKLMVRYAYMQSQELSNRIKQQFIECMRSPFFFSTAVPSIDYNLNKVGRFGMRLYSTGPDHVKNSYFAALVDLVNNAKSKIVIAHMYFHPPQALIDALLKASERGVKIELITNAKGKQAPWAHRFFVDLAQTNYAQLFSGKHSKNIKVYEFYRDNTTYHKKVVVVDDKYTAFGSSNLGTKCLDQRPHDYEFNGIADSEGLAAKTMDILRKDIEMSYEVPPHLGIAPDWVTRQMAWFQEKVMTKIL